MVLLSSSLVHGTAGVALLALAASIATAARAAGGLRRVVVGTGVTAAVLSLTQVGLAVLAVTGADRSTPETSKALFDAINLVDVVKIACLAAFVAVATTATARAGLAPLWLRIVASAVVPLLPGRQRRLPARRINADERAGRLLGGSAHLGRWDGRPRRPALR
jgi:hypothetical protein